MDDLKTKLEDFADNIAMSHRKHDEPHMRHAANYMLEVLWPVIEAAQVDTLPRNNELIQALSELETKLNE